MSRSERQSYVYRITSLERLFALFETKSNVLVSPDLWDDPFENFILKSQHSDRRWFGQCWTRHRASDAMWRIYSKDSEGVRLRSTPQRLCRRIADDLDGFAFIGRVKYLGKDRLVEFARKVIKNRDYLRRSGGGAAKTLLVKRPAFRHEDEVRLLFYRRYGNFNKLFSYSIDPHFLIDQLMLDPRMSIKKAERTAADIRRRTGFQGPIKRSLLYAPPSILTDARVELAAVSAAGRS